jgi:hypothetical protein
VIHVTIDYRSLWEEALGWDEFYLPEMEQRSLWEGIYTHAVIPAWAKEEFGRRGPLKFVVIMEAWCGDAANTMPVLARLVEEVPDLSLRIVLRDQYPAVMDRYLTGTSRSIPIVVVLSPDFRELGHWGPRPTELQAWVMAHKDTIPKAERYAEVRRWYARDRGETTLREILAAVGDR